MSAADLPTNQPAPTPLTEPDPQLPFPFAVAPTEVTPEPLQHEFPLAKEATKPTWEQRAIALEKAIQAANQMRSEYAGRNLLILQLWADRVRGDHDSFAKITKYTKAKKSVIQWVLKMARAGAYDRLVRKAPPGRRGKRKLLLEALRNGTPAPDVQRQLNVHRTTVLRALHQLKSNHKTAA